MWPGTRPLRCWVHKTANVLNKLPKSLQGKAKAALHEIWLAESRQAAQKALAAFVETYGAKYPQAVACLTKDILNMDTRSCRAHNSEMAHRAQIGVIWLHNEPKNWTNSS